jgi:hypothetical protein
MEAVCPAVTTTGVGCEHGSSYAGGLGLAGGLAQQRE